MAKTNKETDVLVNKKPKVEDKVKEVEEALPAPAVTQAQRYQAMTKSPASPAMRRLYAPTPTKVPVRTPTKLVGEDAEVVEAQKVAEAFRAFYGINYDVVNEADEPKVRIPVEEPGGLELKKGQGVENASMEHFKKLIQKDGWDTVSKRIITLKVFNRNKKPALSAKMDRLQAKLAAWVEEKRKKDPGFGK